MSQSGRRNRGRSRSNKQGRGRIDYQSKLSQFDREEDAATFWQRSNARLGIDESAGSSGRAAVEYPCAVCGVFVGLERMPKDRHDVVCGTCRGALGGIYNEEDQEAAADFVKARKSKQRGMLDGLPEMTEEDLEAVSSIKALFDNQSAGRSGNRRRGSSNRNKKRRTGSGNRNQSSESTSRGGANKGASRRRRRGGRRSGSGGRQQASSQNTPASSKNAEADS